MKEKTPKKMNKIMFQVKRTDIDYIRNTLESYDGMALVRTVDPYKALIEVYVASESETFLFELIESMRNREGITLIRYDK